MSSYIFNLDEMKYDENRDDDLIEKYFNTEEYCADLPITQNSEESNSFYYNANNYGYPNTNTNNHINIDDSYIMQITQPNDNNKNYANIIPEANLCQNTKKIKRDAARQRAQIKKSLKDGVIPTKEETMSQIGNSDNVSKAGSSDDPSDKRLKQMIRNRISAQNSRDRKKTYLTNLETSNRVLQMQNTNLLMEIADLKESNRKILAEKESILSQTRNEFSACPNCGYSTSGSPSTDERISIPANIDEPLLVRENSGASGRSSPSFSRLFSRSPRTYFSYMVTLATIFSITLLLNLSDNDSTKNEISANKFYIVGPLKNISTMPPEKTIKLETPTQIEPIQTFNLTSIIDSSLDLSFLQNIQSFQKYFVENGVTAFFTHLKVDEKIIHPCPSGINNGKTQNHQHEFLNHITKSRNQMIEKTNGIVPVDYEKSKKNKFSTLFCPAGYEFFDLDDNNSIKINPSNRGNINGISESDYIQFYIPKRQIRGVYKDSTLSDIIIPTNINGEISSPIGSDDNTIMEIWCKVFQVRELSSNI